MSQAPPPLPPQGQFVDSQYYKPQPKASGMAIAAMILGILSLMCPLFIFTILALIFGFISLNAIAREPTRLTGRGMALTGIVTGFVSFLFVPLLLIALLLPSLGKARELANRSTCAANLRGIAMSMELYAVANGDSYPVLPYAPYGPGNAGTSGTVLTAPSAEEAAKLLYADSKGPEGAAPERGSPLAAIHMMVMTGDISPKQFLCKSDGNAGAVSTGAAPGGFFANFQADNQLSYSFAYPYSKDGSVGKWWESTSDASLPVGSDMAPLEGTGSPRRALSGTGMSVKAGNSGNHGGDGQNVAFQDGHADWVRTTNVGQGGDNIFTYSGKKGSSMTGAALKAPAPLSLDGTPGDYDVILLPARNLDTGKLW